MKNLHTEIHDCKVCEAFLPLGPKPIVQFSKNAKIAIIGQAPGIKVHQSGIPWNDASGNQLRKWLSISNEDFYNPQKVAIVPMGFCYPGKGKSGDLPPRKECAPLWHQKILDQMPNLELILLIGQYAQNYYLKDKTKANLTETVLHYQDYLPLYFVLPHPSPRNRFWLQKNKWFETDVIPILQEKISSILK